MREIKNHAADPSDETIKLFAMDEPGSGGANHQYHAVLQSGFTNVMHFQHGGVAEVGPNGFQMETYIAACIDRLEAFQRGPFASHDNAVALEHLQMAMDALHERTRKRIKRGVEGKQRP